MKKAAVAFVVIAVLLSDIMCAVVAYAYRDMLCGIAHLGYSAPASVAFLYAILRMITWAKVVRKPSLKTICEPFAL